MDQESPNFQSLRPSSPETGKIEVVKIGTLMQTAHEEEKRTPSTVNEKVQLEYKEEIIKPSKNSELKTIEHVKEKPVVVEEQIKTPSVEMKS